ncbi:MAG: uroporphyrinogen-III synthase [Verrucomicrobiales bacterium]
MDYAQIAAAPGTKVMLMGVGRIRIIAGSLIDAGAAPDTPIALVRWATTPRQETLTGTLADIAGKVEAAGFKAPAVAVIGGVASLRDELAWFDRRPLFGRRIVVTRTRQQAGALSESLRALGADAFELPTIRIDPPEDLMAFGETVQHAHQYDWIVFTSPNGAAAFFEMFFKLYKDARELGNPRIAAIGPGTAAKVREYRFTVDLMPDGDYVAEGLIKAFQDEAGSVENLTFLWPKAEKTREVLGEALTKMGAIVDEVVAYRTVPETEDVGGGQRRFREEGADLITFASSSAVECFLALNLPLPEGLKIASIGPVTTKALEAAGLYADIEAEESTIPGLVSAIEAFYRP